MVSYNVVLRKPNSCRTSLLDSEFNYLFQRLAQQYNAINVPSNFNFSKISEITLLAENKSSSGKLESDIEHELKELGFDFSKGLSKGNTNKITYQPQHFSQN